MNKEEARKRIDKLVKEINLHRYNYHVLDKETLNPKLLDDLKLELFRLENEFPEFINPDSPTQKVAGEVLSKFEKVNHSLPMTSLFDAFSDSDMLAWQARNENYLKREINSPYYCELKFDGLAINIAYKKSLFFQAATRGDGRTGEDVSANIKVISSVPLRLREPSIKELVAIGLNETDSKIFLKILSSGRIEVRGEALMSKKTLEDLNNKYRKEGRALLANARNGAAGSIRQLDSRISAERNLDFYAYDLILFKNEKDILPRGELIKSRKMADDLILLLGFKRSKDNYLAKNLNDVFSYYKKIEQKRDRLDFEIDGVVVKFNDLKMWPVLGVVGKAPRYMMAYKFSAAQAVTRIKDVSWQLGRTGILTPIAIFEPVKVGGALISRATLHNFDEISRLSLKINDSVVIERSGDVIPKVVDVLYKLRSGDEREIVVPELCPICSSKLEKIPAEVAYRCLNKNCYAVNLRKIIHFVSKGAVDMEGIGPKLVEQFLEIDLIRDAADLYFLKKEDLLNLDRFAEKKADNVIEVISKKKNLALSNFIYALGIRHVGQETAELIAKEIVKLKRKKDKEYILVDDLLSFFQRKSEDFFLELNDVGPVVASSIYNFWQDDHNLDLINKFIKIGLKLNFSKILEEGLKENKKLFSKVFVLTGSLESLTREEAKDKIKAAGAKIASDVSNKTDFLLLGKDPGSKYEKAKKMKIKIINEDEFLRMLI